MLHALRDGLSCKIAFDKNFEDVPAIFFFGNEIDAAFELFKRPNSLKNPLFEPKSRS
jgi:hypothetical protein